MRNWTYVVETLDGIELAEVINPDSRRVSAGLKRPATAGFVVPSTDPAAKFLRQRDVLVKAYYGASLRYHGPMVTYQRVAEDGRRSMAVTSSDPYFRLTHRQDNRTSSIVTYTDQDRGKLVKDAIDRQNVLGETGIRTGVQPYQSNSAVTYAVSPFKPVAEMNAELSTGLSGYEWRILPIEYTDGKIGDWYAASVIGTRKDNVVFEYGMGKHNLVKVEEVGDLSTVANDVSHIAEFGPNAPGAPIVNATDPVSIARRGLYMDVAQAQITDTAMRQTLVDEHVRVRSDWKQTYSIEPAAADDDNPARVPVLGVDFDIGDSVRVRASEDDPTNASSVWIDGWLRVYAAELAPDKLGRSHLTLTVVDEEA